MFSFFFFNDTATTEIYTLSLHDALPISGTLACNLLLNLYHFSICFPSSKKLKNLSFAEVSSSDRSEEHTSELQSRQYLVCRLLLEKKKKNTLTKCNH